MNRQSLLIALLLLFLLSGCAESPVASDLRWASIQGGQIEKAQSGEEFYFSVPIDRSVMEPETIPVRIQVSGNVSRGALRFELRSPGGQPVWNSGRIGPGGFSIQTSYSPDQPGTYTLGLVWEENTSAAYNLAWHALKLGPGVLIAGAGMLLVSLAFLGYALRRRLGWRYIGLGAMMWGITVAAKFAFATPVSPGIYQLLSVSRTELFSAGNLAAYVYIGALTGLFEAGLAWLILRRRWGKATWGQALAFGIGFGGVEAALLGLGSLFGSFAGLAAPNALPVPALGALARQSDLWMATAPVAERLFVILAHIFACVLLFFAIARREKKWVWLAILYKTVLDAPGGFAAFWGTSTPGKLWTIEAVIAVVGLVGLAGTLWVARRYPHDQESINERNLLPVQA